VVGGGRYRRGLGEGREEWERIRWGNVPSTGKSSNSSSSSRRVGLGGGGLVVEVLSEGVDFELEDMVVG
jgi:hypothetical protein